MEKQNGTGKREGKGLRVLLVCECVRLSFVFPPPLMCEGFVIRIEMMVGRGRMEIGCWLALRERERGDICMRGRERVGVEEEGMSVVGVV
jgi:hypothetical protein